MKLVKVIGFLFISLFAISANASVMRTVVSENSPGTNGSWSFGTIFTVGANDINVTSLGAYDYLGNGFLSDSIKVGIFDETSGVLLASTDVDSSDFILNSYRYSLVNINLFSGQQYRLVAVSANDNYIQGGGVWNYSTDLSVDGYGYCSSTLITKCDNNTEGDYGMANFQYDTGLTSVPEPETLLIFALGLIGIAVSRKNKNI